MTCNQHNHVITILTAATACGSCGEVDVDQQLVDAVLNAQWFDDEDMNSYIIGNEVEDDWLFRDPSTPLSDEIVGLLQSRPVGAPLALTQEQLDTLGLIEVSDFLKRYDPYDGFYHA